VHNSGGSDTRYYSGYREIRRAYFNWKGGEEPHLNWPSPDDAIKSWEHWYGFYCNYCHKEHLGGCDPERVKYVQSLKKCKNRKCTETIFPEEGKHVCKGERKEVAEPEEAPDVAQASTPEVVKPVAEVKPLAAEGIKRKDVVPVPIKVPESPAPSEAFPPVPVSSVPAQSKVPETFECKFCHKRVEYPHTFCPATLRAEEEAKAAKVADYNRVLTAELRQSKPQIEAKELFSSYYFGDNDGGEEMGALVDEDDRMELEGYWVKDFAAYFKSANAKTLRQIKQLIDTALDDDQFTRVLREQRPSKAAAYFLANMDKVVAADPDDDLGKCDDESDSEEACFDLGEV
jgi:hypothetical protein